LTEVKLLVLALILACPLAAQNVNFNDTALDAPVGEPFLTTTPPPAPSAVKPAKVFDKKFFVVMGALGGAESLRFTTRKLVLDREFAAGAPWVTSVPSNQHMVVKDLALYSSEFLVAYELKKPHAWLPGDRIIRKLWWAYPAVMTTIHIKNAVGNMRTQGPGGCTSMECAEQMQ